MRNYNGIVFTSKDNICTINFIDGTNAFSPNFLERFASICREVANYERIDAVILKSSHPKIFSSGADLSYLKTISGKESENREYSQMIVDMFSAYSKINKPIFVQSQQAAIGGGVYFFTTNKNAVAVLKNGASFCFPNPEKNGLVPIAGAPSLIERLGEENAAKLLSGCSLENGVQIFAKLAIDDGLVNGIIDKYEKQIPIKPLLKKHASIISSNNKMNIEIIDPENSDALPYISKQIKEISSIMKSNPDMLNNYLVESLTSYFLSEKAIAGIEAFNNSRARG